MRQHPRHRKSRDVLRRPVRIFFVFLHSSWSSLQTLRSLCKIWVFLRPENGGRVDNIKEKRLDSEPRFRLSTFGTGRYWEEDVCMYVQMGNGVVATSFLSRQTQYID